MTVKPSISYSDELDESIQTLIDEGVVDSRSEFFQNAAAMLMLMMSQGGAALEAVIEDADDLDDAEQTLERIRPAIMRGLP